MSPQFLAWVGTGLTVGLVLLVVWRALQPRRTTRTQTRGLEPSKPTLAGSGQQGAESGRSGEDAYPGDPRWFCGMEVEGKRLCLKPRGHSGPCRLATEASVPWVCPVCGYDDVGADGDCAYCGMSRPK
jgi:hypothetical protein